MEIKNHKPDIEISYRHLPEEILKDFHLNFDCSIVLHISHDKKEYFDFTGGPADILIYIKEHQTELIAGGLLVNAAYDGIKFAIKNLWKRLIKHYSKHKTDYQDNKNYISLNFEIKPDKTLQYQLKGCVDEKIVDQLTDSIFEYLQNEEKRNNDFNNSELRDSHTLKSRIRMCYNSQTNEWEPVNFTELKKKQ